MGTVLSVASRALLTASERLGLDPGALLRAAGLTAAAVGDPDARIPAARADALWEAAFRASGDPGLAWRAALALRGDEFRVMHHLCASSATLGEALTGVARWLHLVDPRLESAVTEGPRGASLAFGLRGGAEMPRAPTEFTLGALLVCTRHGTGLDWTPERVAVTLARPDDADHGALLRCPIAYGAAATRLDVSLRAWRTPLPSADPSLRRLLDDYAARLDATLDKSDADSLERVREAIAARLRDGPDLGVVARALATSERSLQRDLAAHGTTFRDLVDAVRFERARAWLADPAVSLGEVGWMLGFSDQRAFTRAFGRWAGVPPGAWRAGPRPG